MQDRERKEHALGDFTETSTFPGRRTPDWQKSPKMENQHPADHQDGLLRGGRTVGGWHPRRDK